MAAQSLAMSHSLSRRPRAKQFAAGLFLWLATVPLVLAHDPGLSSIRLTTAPTGLEAVLTIHFYDLEAVDPDLDVNHDGRLDSSEFAQARNRLDQLARQSVTVAVDAEAPLALAQNPQVNLIENNNLQMHLRFVPVATGRRLMVTSPLVPRLPHGHREFIELSNADGKPMGEGFLSASANQLSLDLPVRLNGATAAMAPPSGIRFGQFFFLGATHLLGGYDHLLFLAGLLIVCRSLLKAFQMLTLFTIAHSVTLTLVTLDLIKAPGTVIEPAIAASIAYIGIENIFRPKADLSWRGVLTFSFGLVHGLGFAGALKELGVGSGGSGVFRPLFFFSLGLEMTQLGVAVMVFPTLLWLRTKPAFSRWWLPACSGFIAAAGIFWFVQRVFFGG